MSCSLLLLVYICSDFLAGEEHGEPAEHCAIFRPWYDKDPVDGKGHRAGQVYKHVTHCQDDGQRTSGQSVARRQQITRGEIISKSVISVLPWCAL